MSLSIFVLGLTLAAPSADSVAVAERPRPLELGVVGGAFLPAMAGPQAVTPFRSVGIDFALRFGVRPWAFLAFEAELGHVALRAVDGAELSAYTFGAQAIAEWPALFAPFLLLGGGAMGLPKSGADAVGSPTPSLHWGAGVKHLLGKEVATRAEGRHVIGFDGRHHGELLLGVSFLFGDSEEDSAP
ncbi:MAG: hypothetical protein IPG45_07390 [Deltaproteobacteria bacterium]|nr:hypothetical protein [Deltaproteobacteria bacterium]